MIPSMSRRYFLRSAAYTGAAMTLAPRLSFGAATSSARPNIIVCMVDDMGFSDPGCFGGEIHTPNLDRLAAGGVRFVNFHNAARCCPSRASILTGLYPHQTGVGYMDADAGHPAYQGRLGRPCTTIAAALTPVGYSSAICGKWHLEPNPTDVGFQSSKHWFAQGATSYFYRLDPNGTPSGKTDPTFYATDYYADGVVAEIEHQAGKQPFFIYWTPTAPHYPIHAKADDVARYRETYRGMTPADIAAARHKRVVELGLFPADMPWSLPPIVSEPEDGYFVDYRLDTDPLGQAAGYKKRAWKSTKYDSYGNSSDTAEVMAMYAAMIDRFDQGLGRVLETLERTGQWENTLITFCSDNGCCDEPYAIGKRLSNASDTPFLRVKKSAYAGGNTTPLILHWPAGTPAAQRGSINRTFGHIVDILPTALAAAGGAYPETNARGENLPPPEGRSLLPTLRGETIPLEKPIFQEHGGNCAVITERWKLVADGSESWHLYDLVTDRFERNDVAAANPAVVADMSAQWQAWADRTGALRTGQPKIEKKESKKAEAG